MDQIPHLPLKLIFEHLSFQDILHLFWTPSLRNVMFDFYKTDMNQKDLIRLGLLEIFDDFIIFYYYISDFMNFLLSKGITHFDKSARYKRVKYAYTTFVKPEEWTSVFDYASNHIIEFSSVKEKSEKEKIAFLVETHSAVTIHDLVLQCNDFTRERTRSLNGIMDHIYEETERAYEQHVADFLETFFYDPQKGFQNVLELFEQIANLKRKKREKVIQKYGTQKPLQLLFFLERLLQ